VDMLLDCRLATQGSLVRLQSFVIQPDGLMSVYLDT
jgi:hypothetical protein